MIGVLMMNTGTPDAPTTEAIRPYLRQFLSDRRIVNCPPIIWKPILEHIVLRRPEKTVANYQAFWTPEGSPFMRVCKEQAQILQELLDASEAEGAVVGTEGVKVVLAMRYGNPSIASGLAQLAEAGVDTVVALPMYPQRTLACAVSCFDEVDAQVAALASAGTHLQVHKIQEFWQESGYIKALADSVRRAWTPSTDNSSHLVVSFHSVPVSYVKQGDTYVESARQTVEQLRCELGLSPNQISIAFQSRFDSRKWVGPFLEHEVSRLAREGVRDLAVVAPIFTADCIETSVEIAQSDRDLFIRAWRTLRNGKDKKDGARSDAKSAVVEGSTVAEGTTVVEGATVLEGAAEPRFTYVPALGTDPAFLQVIANCVRNRIETLER